MTGAAEYANWAAHLLSWEQCQPLLANFCAEAGLPQTAAGFTTELRERLQRAAAELDAGYPDNADLVIDEAGTPTLKRHRGRGNSASADALAEAIKQRMSERSLLGIVARTAYWLQWWRHFGPASGSDPKLKDPQGRYVLTTFSCGVNMAYAEAARHLAGISAHELSMTANRHVSITKLNKASADVINAFAHLDVVKAWGDGSVVAADGTQIDTYIDNLLAESSIRYGGIGGIAYHYVSDTYIALFSRFISCGVWEAIYLIDGLLQNSSDIKPNTIHADTQGLVVTWTSCPSLRVRRGRSGRRMRRFRGCMCGYGSSAVRMGFAGSICWMGVASRSRSCRGSCGSWRLGTARPIRSSLMPTISAICGGSSTVMV
ncbi:MAG: Tn3 family transposase [Pseudonocardiaceae bacterium]